MARLKYSGNPKTTENAFTGTEKKNETLILAQLIYDNTDCDGICSDRWCWPSSIKPSYS